MAVPFRYFQYWPLILLYNTDRTLRQSPVGEL